MQVRQCWSASAEDEVDWDELASIDPQLVLVFGALDRLDDPLMATLKERLPGALAAGCSTAGEIHGTQVADGSLSLTAIRLDRSRVEVHQANAASMVASRACGEDLARDIVHDELQGVVVFAPGVDLNGSALIEGLRSSLPASVPLTGGLAGDGGAFVSTRTVTPSGLLPRGAVALSFHGPELRFGHGTFGGWAPFGPARKITRCAGNVLYELDGRPALGLYKEYLGDHATKLPAAGLLFPFEMLDRTNSSQGLIRTILAVDEAEGSLTLAGDIDPDGYLRLMHASSENLADGAETAAREARSRFQGTGASFGLLVSCVGRKLVMGDRVEDEVMGVAEILGVESRIAGFYSNGEIAPHSSTTDCKLHNQTMTITWLGEG